MKLFLTLLFVLLSSSVFAAESRLVQGGFFIGQAPAGFRPFYGDRPLAITPEGYYLVGFGRDAEAGQQIALINDRGEEKRVSLNIRARDYSVERINGISRRMMEPSAEDLVRIRAEASEVREVRNLQSPLRNFLSDFTWPLKGRISGTYGSQRILNGEPRRPHFGIDISAPRGTPVVAPADGIVRLAHRGMFFSGRTLILDHGHGLTTSYLHLDEILVEDGEQVTQGEEIARVGATGRVTGPHLDWRMNWFETRLDPSLWVEPPN